jgi:chromosome segregation ATPase
MTARVRDLETQVAAKDAELKQLRASQVSLSLFIPLTTQASTSASTSTPATDFYGAPVEPKRDSGSGVNNNIDSTRQLAELTAERDAEREFARASRAEAASLKARLDDAGRQRDKAMNDMLVAEKRAAKAREALEDTVADLRFELDARGGNTGLVEKVRDELRTERERADALAAAGQEKDARVAEKEAEVATLAAKVEEGAGVVVALNARIAVLEVGAIELASARESVVALTARVPELEAEIAAAGTARAALEERLVSATTEHATLAATLEEKAAALTTAEATRAALALQIAVLQPLTSELESARAALVAKDANAAALQSQLAAAGGVTTALAAKDAELASAHDVNSTLSRELAALEDALAGVHDELDSARARADEQARTLAAERDALAVAKAELIGAQRAHRNAEENGRLLRAEIERLVAEPQQGESSGGEVPALREQLAASTQAVNVLEGQVLTLQALAPAEPRKDVEKDMDTRFEQMTATIVRLRAERDDAASSLRFSEAERGFLLDGLRGEADATAAALVAKTEAHDALVAERAELVARVSELEVAVDAAKVSGSAELAAVIAARDAALARVSALEPQIAELERELDVTKAELAARDADLERERARRAEAEAHAAAMGGAAGADERAKLQIDELEGRVGRRNSTWCRGVDILWLTMQTRSRTSAHARRNSSSSSRASRTTRPSCSRPTRRRARA